MSVPLSQPDYGHQRYTRGSHETTAAPTTSGPPPIEITAGRTPRTASRPANEADTNSWARIAGRWSAGTRGASPTNALPEF
jgi:hypothetical protein